MKKITVFLALILVSSLGICMTGCGLISSAFNPAVKVTIAFMDNKSDPGLWGFAIETKQETLFLTLVENDKFLMFDYERIGDDLTIIAFEFLKPDFEDGEYFGLYLSFSTVKNDERLFTGDPLNPATNSCHYHGTVCYRTTFDVRDIPIVKNAVYIFTIEPR